MEKRIYKDKHGKQIEAGMKIRHDNGDVELVYTCGEYDEELGVNASNEKHVNFTEETREFYPLHQFTLKEWEIVND